MTLDEVKGEIAWHLDEIKPLFKPGVKLTILVRNPHIDEADIFLTDDDIDLAVKSIRRLQALAAATPDPAA
jgi:hypothetical protein